MLYKYDEVYRKLVPPICTSAHRLGNAYLPLPLRLRWRQGTAQSKADAYQPLAAKTARNSAWRSAPLVGRGWAESNKSVVIKSVEICRPW